MSTCFIVIGYEAVDGIFRFVQMTRRTWRERGPAEAYAATVAQSRSPLVIEIPVTAIDPRYQHCRCSVCGRLWQNLDFGSAHHRLSCPDFDRAYPIYQTTREA